MDPVTIIGGATVAFNALKKGFQFGKDLQEMGGQLNQWASIPYLKLHGNTISTQCDFNCSVAKLWIDQI